MSDYNRNTRAIPTLGYPSQKLAIEALYAQGVDVFEIIKLTEASVNSTYRAISDYKKRHGIKNQPLRKQMVIAARAETGYANRAKERGVWSLNDNDRRMAFHAKAVKAAREARLSP